jgi:hypothetical protein
VSELREVFEDIAARNGWGDEESRSGAGSTLRYTHGLRAELRHFLDAFRIGNMFDAPCGDFHWMKAVEFPDGFHYIGGDVAPSVVAANTRTHSRPGRQFVEFDITRDAFPWADLWFCRDCLFHLSYADIFRALEAFARSDIGYVMVTSHINAAGFHNRDIASGDFRLLDMFIEPFGLPPQALYRIPDYVFPFPPRELCVWSRRQIVDTLNRRRG